MLVIRKEQMEVFQNLSDKAFAAKIISCLRQSHPEWFADIPEDSLVTRTLCAIRRSRRYHLGSDEDVVTFVALMFSVAPDFDTHPPIHAVLTDQNISVSHRIAALLCLVAPADWDRVRERPSAEAWRQIIEEEGSHEM